MPLRDHFHPPLSDRRSWEGVHGCWPAMIVDSLNRWMPSHYAAEPQVHLGSSIEVDVAAFGENEADVPPPDPEGEAGGVAVAVWPRPVRPSPSSPTRRRRPSTR